MMQWNFPDFIEQTVIDQIWTSWNTAHRRILAAVPRACLWAIIAASHHALGQEATSFQSELKLSVVVAPLYPMGAAAKAWADAINDSAAGVFSVKFYPGAVLAGRDPTEEFKSLQSGAIDIAVGSALQWSDAFAPLGVFALPWIASSNAQLATVVADRVVHLKLTAALDAAGVTLLAIAPLRHRDLATQSRVVGSPSDLRDLRVRVTGPKLVTDTYIALGARPTGLNLEDARDALVAGQIDGQDQSAAALVAARAWATGTHHIVQWGAFGNAMMFVVRKPLWESWSEATQAKVREAALKAVEAAQASAREHEAHDELARNGISITRMTPAGHAAFRALVEPVYSRWTPKMGADLVEAVRTAADKAGVSSGRGAHSNLHVSK